MLCPSAPGTLKREVLDGIEIVRYRYAPRKLESLINNGGMIANIRSKPWKVLLLPSFLACQLIAALWFCFRRRPAVIHAHWLIPQGVIAAIVSVFFRGRIPFVVTCHGTDIWGLRGRLMLVLKKWASHKATAVTVVSRPMVGELNSQVGVLGNVTVAPMGVDLESCFVDTMHIKRKRNQILSVGRLIKNKGVEYLVRAMPDIVSEFPDIKLLIVGDGPERKNLEFISRSLGIEDFCEFVGQKPQCALPELYRSSSVFVAPFLQEGLGLVSVEALGCGCPVVASDIPAMGDISVHSGGVRLVPPRDSKALADSVLSVLRELGVQQEAVCQSVPAIRAQFGWPSVSTRYSETLQRAADMF